MNKNLLDKFDMAGESKTEIEVYAPKTEISQGAEDDFDYARENLYKITELGQNALEELNDLAVSSQNARTYEVLANLLGKTIEANKAIMELRKQKEEMAGPKAPTSIHTHNNLTMTTEALSKLLKEKSQENS